MLAQPIDMERIPTFRFIQPKLDGIRLIWDGIEAYSRNGKPIQGYPSLIKNLKEQFRGIPLDGELYHHGTHFQKLVSSVRRSRNIIENPNIKYHVFDHPIKDSTFSMRWNLLLPELRKINSNLIVAVETVDASKIPIDELNIFINRGYEGTMIRNGHSYYEFGKRSFELLKLKPINDDDGIIIGFQEGEGKYEGMLGALECQTISLNKNFEVVSRVKFKLGSGFTDEQRMNIWKAKDLLLGKLVTYKYQELTLDGVPRFPRFKSIRDYE